MATRIDPTEHAIHMSIVDLLPYILPAGAIFHHSPNEVDAKGADIARAIAKAKKLGMVGGWPDIEIIWRGGFYALEVKTRKSSQSDDQAACQQMIEGAGGKYAVIRSSQAAEQQLAAWGVTKAAGREEARRDRINAEINGMALARENVRALEVILSRLKLDTKTADVLKAHLGYIRADIKRRNQSEP